MLQGIMEMIFDLCYFAIALTVGLILVVKGKTKYFKLFGIMAIVLASGDSFHLVPRIVSLLGDGMEANAWALGFGQLITSITMTIFYVILYFVWELRAKPEKTTFLRVSIIMLALARIIICCFPQNNWFNLDGNFLFGILRNVPFAIIGIIIIVLSFMQYKQNSDKDYMYMGIAIILSFAFYIPVVLFAGVVPAIGALMIPKTIAYVWIVMIGFSEHRKFLKQENSDLAVK
ncbi:MAG: hypothetical protein RR357_02740 [Clostridia bacterium]